MLSNPESGSQAPMPSSMTGHTHKYQSLAVRHFYCQPKPIHYCVPTYQSIDFPQPEPPSSQCLNITKSLFSHYTYLFPSSQARALAQSSPDSNQTAKPVSTMPFSCATPQIHSIASASATYPAPGTTRHSAPVPLSAAWTIETEAMCCSPSGRITAVCVCPRHRPVQTI